MKPEIYHNLSDIPKLEYEGYIWYSDMEEPRILTGQNLDFLDKTTNLIPFIIEGLLYNEEKNISIHITHSGQYQIVNYQLNTWEDGVAEIVEKSFLPHRLNHNITNLKFKQLWIREKDELCEGMEVKQLKAIAFCGFKFK